MKLILERVTIIDFSKELIPSFMIYHNDLEWMKYQGFKGLSQTEYERELLSNKTAFEGKQLAIIENNSGKLVGDIFVKRENEAECWIGYTVNPEFRGKKMMKEALNGLFNELKKSGVNKIFAEVLTENKASIFLLEGLNFDILKADEKELVYVLGFK